MLAIFQALHSVEECYFSLWEVFAPARFLSGLVSQNLRVGFVVINATIVALVFYCYAFPVRREDSYAPIVIWFWILLEFGNGVGHNWFAVSAGTYFPGFYTAPFLLLTSCYLAWRAVQHPVGNQS